MSFDNFGLSPAINNNLHNLGYHIPTPVQAKPFPPPWKAATLSAALKQVPGRPRHLAFR